MSSAIEYINHYITYIGYRRGWTLRWILITPQTKLSGIVGIHQPPPSLASSTFYYWVLPNSYGSQWLAGAQTNAHLIKDFCQNITQLLKAGIPLIHCIEMTNQAIHHAEFKMVLQLCQQEITSGKTLSESLQSSPRFFHQTMIKSIAIAEKSGQLSQGLESVAAIEQWRLQTKATIKQKIRYPLFIACFSAGLLTFFSLCVIPVFATIFIDLGQDPPASVAIMLSINEGITNYMPLTCWISFITSTIWFFIPRHESTHSYQLRWRHIRNIARQFPPYHRINRKYYQQFLCLSLAFLWDTQPDICTALDILASCENDRHKQQAILSMRTKIQYGASFAEACQASGLFETTIITRLTIAEKATCMPQTLHMIATECSDDIQQHITRYMAWIEPMCISITGCMIGAILVGLYEPILSIADMT